MKIKLSKNKRLQVLYDDNILEVRNQFLIKIKYLYMINMSLLKKITRMFPFSNSVYRNKNTKCITIHDSNGLYVGPINKRKKIGK